MSCSHAPKRAVSKFPSAALKIANASYKQPSRGGSFSSVTRFPFQVPYAPLLVVIAFESVSNNFFKKI